MSFLLHISPYTETVDICQDNIATKKVKGGDLKIQGSSVSQVKDGFPSQTLTTGCIAKELQTS